MPEWISGPESGAAGPDRHGALAPMLRASVGYYADRAQYQPTVGAPFTAHLVVRVGHPPRGGVVHRARLRLPPGLSLTDDPPTSWRSVEGQPVLHECTADPAVGVPSPALLPDGTFDLGWRDLPAGTVFEVRVHLRADRTMADGRITGLLDSEYGTEPLRAAVTVRIFPEPVAVGSVRVEVRPRWLPMGRPIMFTVLTSDDTTGRPVEGVVRFRAHDQDGRPEVLELPTNTPAAHTFRARYGEPPSEVVLPSAELLVPGHNDDGWRPLPVFAPL